VLRPIGVIEMVRTGRIAMARGGTRATRAADPTAGDLIADDVSIGSV
jgi:hypothetical protein